MRDLHLARAKGRDDSILRRPAFCCCGDRASCPRSIRAFSPPGRATAPGLGLHQGATSKRPNAFGFQQPMLMVMLCLVETFCSADTELRNPRKATSSSAGGPNNGEGWTKTRSRRHGRLEGSWWATLASGISTLRAGTRNMPTGYLLLSGCCEELSFGAFRMWVSSLPAALRHLAI